jgi:hypothetical protein
MNGNGTAQNGDHPPDEQTSIPETDGLEEQNDEDEEDISG